MREFLKLDAVMQKVSKLIKNGGRIKKMIKVVTFGWTLFNVIAVIWSLVPKHEKISEAEAEKLIEALTDPEKENPGEPVPQELIEV